MYFDEAPKSGLEDFYDFEKLEGPTSKCSDIR
jgi:hypothetical protein